MTTPTPNPTVAPTVEQVMAQVLTLQNARDDLDWDRAFDELAYLRSMVEALAVDAGRYRWLRDTVATSVACGFEANDEKLVYEDPLPGTEVRIYWYPDTPIGFYESRGSNLDEAVDAARTPLTAQGELPGSEGA